MLRIIRRYSTHTHTHKHARARELKFKGDGGEHSAEPRDLVAFGGARRGAQPWPWALDVYAGPRFAPHRPVTLNFTPQEHVLRRSGMPARATRSPNTTEIKQTTFIRAHVMIGESVNVNATNIGQRQCRMAEELPILKGILKGVVNYHNARRCHF
ncbi:hypothetical protein WA026_007001 [Henosepilachna vigintioctopunctata]|uniref:Uncharacterized protein n=1 Tax=Henosepilachna vigintioctopunctata TaxID=420089 RepID=A0AAW1VA61_9CUCU